MIDDSEFEIRYYRTHRCDAPNCREEPKAEVRLRNLPHLQVCKGHVMWGKTKLAKQAQSTR